MWAIDVFLLIQKKEKCQSESIYVSVPTEKCGALRTNWKLKTLRSLSGNKKIPV